VYQRRGLGVSWSLAHDCCRETTIVNVVSLYCDFESVVPFLVKLGMPTLVPRKDPRWLDLELHFLHEQPSPAPTILRTFPDPEAKPTDSDFV
jgi:hypothetical protein